MPNRRGIKSGKKIVQATKTTEVEECVSIRESDTNYARLLDVLDVYYSADAEAVVTYGNIDLLIMNFEEQVLGALDKEIKQIELDELKATMAQMTSRFEELEAELS